MLTTPVISASVRRPITVKTGKGNPAASRVDPASAHTIASILKPGVRMEEEGKNAYEPQEARRKFATPLLVTP